MNLNAKEGQAETEIVHAKFVVGADGQFTSTMTEVLYAERHCLLGAHSWVRKTLGIAMDGEQTGRSTIDIHK